MACFPSFEVEEFIFDVFLSYPALFLLVSTRFPTEKNRKNVRVQPQIRFEFEILGQSSGDDFPNQIQKARAPMVPEECFGSVIMAGTQSKSTEPLNSQQTR